MPRPKARKRVGQENLLKNENYLRDNLKCDAEMGEVLENEEISAERRDIMDRTLELVEWENELQSKNDSLKIREEVLRIQSEDVDRRLAMTDQMRKELDTIRVSIESSSADNSSLQSYLQRMHYESIESKRQTGEMRAKVADLKAKLDATTKRLNRLSAANENRPKRSRNEETKKRSRMSYTECAKPDKDIRMAEVCESIKAAVGITEENEKFHSVLKRVFHDAASNCNLKMRFTAEEDAKFANLFNIPQNARQLMKTFFRSKLDFDPFCSNWAFRIQRQSCMNEEDWEFKLLSESGGATDGKKGRQAGYSYFNKNIHDVVATHIKSLAEGGKLILDEPYNNTVSLIFQLDKGGATTKCGISVSNLEHKVGSPNNFMLLGLSSVAESYDTMKEAFGDIFQQLNSLNGSSIIVKVKSSELSLKIRIKVGGDFKSICMMMGHSGASSKMMCPICECTKPLMKNWDTWKELPYRTNYSPGEKNITRHPLIPTITATDICVPITHVLTGLTKKGMTILEKKIMGESTEWDDELTEALNETSRLMRYASEGLKVLREFKGKVMEIMKVSKSQATEPLQKQGSCSKLCIHHALSADTTLDWDLILCQKCTRANHIVCTRNWDLDLYTTSKSKNFICIDCTGISNNDLIQRDKDCLDHLEEQESELMDSAMENENKWNQLSHQESRSESRLVEELKKMRIDCGVYPRFYYNDLVGEDSRRLTMPENSVRLWSLVEDDETRTFGTALFDTLYQLFKILHVGFQTEEERNAFGYLIERIQKLWTSIHPNETVTLKLHSLCHLREAMKREGYAGREIETIEHVHRSINVLWPKYATVQPLKHRLFIIVSRFNARNTLCY